MSRIAVRVEHVRARFDGAAQRALNERKAQSRRLSEQNLREAMAQAARADLERAVSDLSERQAEIYRAELRRLLALSLPDRPVRSSLRAEAEALFNLGEAA